MKKIRSLTFTIIAFLFYLTASGQSNNINADSVNLTLQFILEKYNIPGISLVIAKSDTILLINSTGVRNLSTLESLKITDRMHIGSCTKAITGFAAGALVKVGLIKWESTIIEIFPEFKNTIKRDYYNTTLKDLLSHHARVLPFDSLEEWIEMDKKDQFNNILYEIYESLQQIKLRYSIANLLLKAYFLVWISHKTLFCCRQAR